MLTEIEIQKIADAVVERISTPGVMSLAQAARYMGIKAKPENLPSTFSRFSNPEYYSRPLKCTRIGKERVYRIEDLDAFMKNRGRGF